MYKKLVDWRFWLGIPHRTSVRPDLSMTVVIPAYNEENSIAKTIKSIQGQSIPADIIVVDDCSSDRTGEIARSLGVKVIRPETNSGTKAQALNLAIPEVNTDLFICVDADTELYPDALEKALYYFDADDVGMVCGCAIPQNSGTIWEKARVMEYLYAFPIIKGAQEQINHVLIASGCFTLIRTNLLRDMGGYDPRTMAEDMDLTWIFADAGYKVRFASEAMCAVVDPHDRITYHKQVSRWTHGYIQNLRVRKYKFDNKVIGIMAMGYFLWAILFSILPIFTIVTIGVLDIPIGHKLTFLGGWILYYMVSICLISSIKAFKLRIKFTTFISCIIPVYLVQFYTSYIFIETVVKEYVLNRTLTVWHKGHV